MAQFSTDFSLDTVDVAPADWTETWAGANTDFLVRDKSSDLGGNVLEKECTTGQTSLLTWDDVGSVTDVDILLKFRSDTATTVRFGARTNGSLGSHNGYIFGADFGGWLVLAKWTSGGYSNINTPAFSWSINTWYWLRYRVSGTTHYLSAWADGGSEPGTPQVNGVTDSAHASGLVGVDGFGATTCDVDYFAVGTGGDVAPDWSAPADPPARFWDGTAWVDASTASFWDGTAWQPSA